MKNNVSRVDPVNVSRVNPVDQAMFDEGINQFFDVIFDKADEGRISTDEAENFFPKEVVERCKS